MSRTQVPGIAALREICHGAKLAQDPRPVYVLTRRVSIYLTWLLLHTGFTPNQVTALSVFLGMLGSVLLAFPGGGWALAGALAFLAHQLVDKVDGDVARFRKMYSIVGVYLDELGHSLAFGGIFLGLGVHLAWASDGIGRIATLVVAAIGALAMVIARHHKNIGFQLYAQHAMSRPYLIPQAGTERGPSSLGRAATQEARRSGRSRGPMALARDVVLQLSDFLVMVLFILIGAIFQLATGSEDLLRCALYSGAALHVAVLVALVVVNITVNVESEVRRLDQAAHSARDPGSGSRE